LETQPPGGQRHHAAARPYAGVLVMVQWRYAAERRACEADRHHLDVDQRKAEGDARQAVLIFMDLAGGGDQSRRGAGDDQNLEAPEQSHAADLEQPSADGHRLDGTLCSVDRGRQRVGRLAPQQQATPEQGLPDLHDGKTRRPFGLASGSRLRFANFQGSRVGQEMRLRTMNFSSTSVSERPANEIVVAPSTSSWLSGTPGI